MFDSDDEVELLAVYQSYVSVTDTSGYYVYHTRVIDEDGSLMLDVPNGGYSTVISNGPNENKLLILVYDFSTSPYIVTTNIYSIYGFPVSLPEELSIPGELSAYPNPALNKITIPYEPGDFNANVWITIKNVNGIEITMNKPHFENIHTVTLYIGPDRQIDYYDYILSLKPKRIIFNPGTENPELIELAQENNIETVKNCTLVMLNAGIF